MLQLRCYGMERFFLVFRESMDEKVEGIRCTLREDDMIGFFCIEKTCKGLPGR